MKRFILLAIAILTSTAHGQLRVPPGVAYDVHPDIEEVACERIDGRVFVSRSTIDMSHRAIRPGQRVYTGNGRLIDDYILPNHMSDRDGDGIGGVLEISVYCTDPSVPDPSPRSTLLNICVVADPASGALESRVFIEDGDVRTDDCLYRYGVTQVFDGPGRDLMPVFRHVRPGSVDGHRLSLDAWPRDGETVAELLFYVHRDAAAHGHQLYGYRAADGGWTYARYPLPDAGATAGYVEEVRLF